MIKKVVIKKFKRLNDVSVDLHPETLSLVVGGNNSGKSTLLHAIAVWQYSWSVIRFEKGETALLDGAHVDGLGISLDDFTPLNIPSFKYLWTNLKPGSSYTLTIDCYWDLAGAEKHLCIGLAFGQDRLYVKNVGSNLVAGDKIPNVAYVPPFAGIANKEQWYAPAMRNMLIGQGLAGAVLRNQIVDLFRSNLAERKRLKGNRTKISRRDLEQLRENDPYELLNQTVFKIFKGQLYPERFNEEFHTHVSVGFRKGEIVNKRFAPFPSYTLRDIMAEGSGFLQWLSVYTFALSPNIDVLLLDEPDAHLHRSLQNELLDLLRNIALKKHKQVLVATHSTEVIRGFDYHDIIHADKGHYHYLSDGTRKAYVMSGLGTEYFILLDGIQRHKKILFVENRWDAEILKRFCNKYSQWPDNIVVWNDANMHCERKKFFMELHRQIPDLKAISLHDRDNGSYEQTNQDLSVGDQPDWSGAPANSGEIRFRTWRRWEMESYLMGIPAMKRIYQREHPAMSPVDVENEVNRQLAAVSVVINAEYMQSDRTPGNQSLFQNDAKVMLDPLLNSLGLDKWEVIEEMTDAEIFEDVRTLIDEIVAFGRL